MHIHPDYHPVTYRANHTLLLSRTHFLLYAHEQAVYCLDIPSMTKRDKHVCSEHILALLSPPSPPVPLLSPLLFITQTRATQSSSLSTAPIHQHTAITCCCSVIDYFSCADVLAYQTLRKWQIRSLCPFMIMGLVFFYILVFIRCKFVLCYIRSIFHCRILPRRTERRRWVGSF